MTDKVKFEWDPKKRQKNIDERGLDIVMLAPDLLASPSTKILPDKRKNYDEERWLAFGIVEKLRLCLCFTQRGDSVRLITIYKVNNKDWEKHYGKDD